MERNCHSSARTNRPVYNAQYESVFELCQMQKFKNSFVLNSLVKEGSILRLVDGTSISGRLEVFSLARGWTDVCWNNWTSANTRFITACLLLTV